MKEVITQEQKKFLLDNMAEFQALYESKKIYNIRELAKAFGVQSPTSKKKEENWKIIQEILTGQTEAKYSKSATEDILSSYRAEVNRWIDKLYKSAKITADNNGGVNGKESLRNDDDPVLDEPFEVKGRLDILEKKYGFLRTGREDVFVDGQLIRNLSLRECDVIEGFARKEDKAKSAKLQSITSVNGVPFEEFVQMAMARPLFENLKATFPNKRLRLEGKNSLNFALRAIDLVAPIGRGQRGLIVSPPKAGKTTLLKQIAQSLIYNYRDDLHVMMLLIDERPEEVTDMENEFKGCEIISSTFDQDQEHHIKVAEQTLTRAKRMVESGKDVVILLDSITRLARAYNQVGEASGRTLSGGLDVAALREPKRFFGAARNTSGNGSLTIIATALVNTGSRMDDVIYEEFKGTGNMEIHLDRKLSERRIFPAIDLEKSGTRREDLLYDDRERTDMWAMRRILSKNEGPDKIEYIFDLLTKTKTNEEFLTMLEISMKKSK